MHWWNRRGQNEKNGKKMHFIIRKKIFSLLLFLGCSFAFQRWFVELKKALLWHFKSLKMEKNWERFAKVIGDRLVINDGPFYPNMFWTMKIISLNKKTSQLFCFFFLINKTWTLILTQKIENMARWLICHW
jgi:hypothetical protein